jgi:hypothetical protein
MPPDKAPVDVLATDASLTCEQALGGNQYAQLQEAAVRARAAIKSLEAARSAIGRVQNEALSTKDERNRLAMIEYYEDVLSEVIDRVDAALKR